ncbi:hypothetical protein QOZ88_20915 [Blastococcus sp. BMG 814]|uniref:Secreted protein n=1 Tax=Blastococcus carthaginiensis TaxID=3050034 RepID=A0ABT9IHP3_9ACTN|nr:hypothetical protein [Blastococcus carthaginiensis]MDP5185101.1 hypothetical protein [Blastococcus carthaginiensis]
MPTTRRLTAVCSATAFAGILAAGPALAAGTVTITPEEGADWYFSSTHHTETGAPTPTTGTGEVVATPAAGSDPWGTHVYQLAVDTSQKARLETSLLNGRPLAELNGVTYSTYSTGLPGYGPSINVTIDPEGEDDFVTLVWEANKAGFAMADGTWQDWDTTTSAGSSAGGWWTPSIQPFSSATPGSNRTPTDLATLVEFYGEGSTITGFAVNVGRHGAMTAYVDGIGITVGGDTTTYDVQPAVRLTGKQDCKDGGWATSTDPVFRNQGACVSHFARR